MSRKGISRGHSEDITGRVFNHLTVLRLSRVDVTYSAGRPSGRKTEMWECRCSCGNIGVYSKPAFRTLQSCGCQTASIITAKKSKGRSQHPYLYKIWGNMKTRCTNPKTPQYADYGGRGITVHAAWVNGNEGFMAFVADVGQPPTPQHTLDRIDNNGNYEPSNVRWATRLEQNRNRRDNLYMTYKGEQRLVVEVAAEVGLPPQTLRNRIYNKCPEDHLFNPVGIGPKRTITTHLVRNNG